MSIVLAGAIKLGLVQEHNTMTLAELVFETVDLKSGARHTRDTITICPLRFSSKAKTLFHEITMKLLTN